MTSKGRIRRRIAGSITLIAVIALGLGITWFQRKLPKLPTVDLATCHLPDPVVLTEGDAFLHVTQFLFNQDRMTLTLEQDELSFDDYGDATRTGGKAPLVLAVRLVREGLGNCFEILTANRFQEKLRIAVPNHGLTHHRLIVVGEKGQIQRVLELRGPEIITDEIGDRPQSDRFSFAALALRRSGDGRPGLQNVGISGSLSGGGRLSFDPNHLHFAPDGWVNGSTCLGWTPIEVTFKPLDADPAGMGRRALELVPRVTGNPIFMENSYVLVLGPTELDEHRLIYRSSGKAVQILRLRNEGRDVHLYMLQKLKDVPADERAAFLELGQVSGYRMIVEAHEGHIAAIYQLEGDLARVDQLLARLPHIRSLAFTDATLPASGLPSLDRMKDLRAISFNSSRIDDAGLAQIGRAVNLVHLTFFGCQGPTGAGLEHLAPLTRLETFQVRREDNPEDPPLFDDGMKHFAGMTRLTNLNLHGQKFTDAGLVHIGRLTSLRQLYLSGGQITAQGLRHFEGLKNLEEFTFYGSTIPPEAMAEFRAKLPGLKKP